MAGVLEGRRISIPLKSTNVTNTRADLRAITGALAKPDNAGYEAVSASVNDAAAGTGARTISVAEIVASTGTNTVGGSLQGMLVPA